MKTRAAHRGLFTEMLRVATLSVVLSGALMIGSGWTGGSIANAQVSPPGDVYKVAYFDVGDHSGAPVDNRVRIANPTSANGDLCAMLYVFDKDEELQECCGCPLTPNDLLSLSVDLDLTQNPWGVSGTRGFKSGVIEVVSALPNRTTGSCNTADGCFGGCDPTASYKPTAELEAWVTHADAFSVPNPGSTGGAADGAIVTGASTSKFGSAGFDQVQRNYLVKTCNLIVSNGSGAGVCTCGDSARTTTVFQLR